MIRTVCDMNSTASTNKLLLIVLAFLLPPAAVAIKDGIGTSFVINLILTLILWLPGVIHALLVVA